MQKLLIANRGEIACRVIAACRALGVEAVAVYSEADAGSLHVEFADEAVCIGPAKPQESYLKADAILAAAGQSGADAIHPGYGFLAENADFARAVEQAGLVWVGPRPDSITDMGDKERARQIAQAVRVPILPGSRRFGANDLADLATAADEIGYPLLVKAAAGGGGIGMGRVNDPADLTKTATATQTMAERSFGDGTIYLEHLITKARHIEVQVFGFGDGRAVHLNERECSIQRRYQKIIEECPAPGLSQSARMAMAEAALRIAEAQRYRGAGTVEFVLDDEAGEFFFLEMNTRIQVEHPVTEMVTGQDLVGLQLRLARGDDLSDLTQDAIQTNGHAIECRLYAENPKRMFLPSPGTLDALAFPAQADGVRIDAGVREGDQITIHYDPMVAKVICHGRDRGEAIAKIRDTLGATRLEGLDSNLEFLQRTLAHQAFAAGDIHTGFIDEHKATLVGD